jgi:hypothetical protein
VTPQAGDDQQTSQGVPPWLRPTELGLGLAIIVLGAVTLVLRWRQV